MCKDSIAINVHMDAAVFKRFARFDTYILCRRWLSPAIFCGLFLGFSASAFSLRSRAEQAGLLGWLLLILGIGLPLAYFLHYEMQLSAQVRRHGIKKPRPAYFLTLSSDSVRIVNNMVREEPLTLSWNDFCAAYLRKDGVYLYQTEKRAFILPAKDASVPLASLWAFLSERLPKEKLHS